ncbi:hypothetical protein GE21DRAFT_1022695 [Neurospora crassa]|nr:hypothetical protein GE21DRAFT_1022695 [Neurospora crassa]
MPPAGLQPPTTGPHPSYSTPLPLAGPFLFHVIVGVRRIASGKIREKWTIYDRNNRLFQPSLKIPFLASGYPSSQRFRHRIMWPFTLDSSLKYR